MYKQCKTSSYDLKVIFCTSGKNIFVSVLTAAVLCDSRPAGRLLQLVHTKLVNCWERGACCTMLVEKSYWQYDATELNRPWTKKGHNLESLRLVRSTRKVFPGVVFENETQIWNEISFSLFVSFNFLSGALEAILNFSPIQAQCAPQKVA